MQFNDDLLGAIEAKIQDRLFQLVYQFKSFEIIVTGCRSESKLAKNQIAEMRLFIHRWNSGFIHRRSPGRRQLPRTHHCHQTRHDTPPHEMRSVQGSQEATTTLERRK